MKQAMAPSPNHQRTEFYMWTAYEVFKITITINPISMSNRVEKKKIVQISKMIKTRYANMPKSTDT